MRTDPATSDQRELAEALGVELPLDATIETASRLISAAPASTKQRLQANELALRLPERVTFSEAKRLLAAAYRRAGRRVVTTMQLRVGDVLLKDSILWEVKNIFDGYRISLKAVRPVRSGRDVIMVPTGEAGKCLTLLLSGLPQRSILKH